MLKPSITLSLNIYVRNSFSLLFPFLEKEKDSFNDTKAKEMFYL